MKKWSFLFVFVFSLVGEITAQYDPGRYRKAIFPNVQEIEDVLFAPNVPIANPGGGFYEGLLQLPVNVNETDTSHINLYMDIFQPLGDTLIKRPLVIICFGGGFIAGTRKHWSIRLLAQELARQGYVTAAIDYRLGMNLFDEELGKRAVYRGVQDGRAAVRFFKADASGANEYKIDTSNIFMGGHSAGAFIALHNAYLDKESERPEITISGFQGGVPLLDQGCLDCVGGNTSFNGQVKSVFSLAGAVGSLSYLESMRDPDVVLFHSQDDGTVPYAIGEPFMDISVLIFGSELPIVYGSSQIALRADSINLPNQFYSYNNRGHSLHENGDTLHNDIIPGISDWFFDQHLKPEPRTILGDSILCESHLVATYSTVESDSLFSFWEVSGGQIVGGNESTDSIVVEWNIGDTSHTVSLTTFNCIGAADSTGMEVNFDSISTNTWIANSGSWFESANWSSGLIPSECSEVIIPSAEEPILITVQANSDIQIQKIELGQNIFLDIAAGTFFEIMQ